METAPNSKMSEDGCKCKRSKCLKKYCECFAAMVLCSVACHCQGCENTTNSKSRVEANRKRRQSPNGCKCTKSRCSKRYCECYAAGRGCGYHCKCIGCKNPLDQRPTVSPRTKRPKSVCTSVEALTLTVTPVKDLASSGTHMGELPKWSVSPLIWDCSRFDFH